MPRRVRLEVDLPVGRSGSNPDAPPETLLGGETSAIDEISEPAYRFIDLYHTSTVPLVSWMGGGTVDMHGATGRLRGEAQGVGCQRYWSAVDVRRETSGDEVSWYGKCGCMSTWQASVRQGK